MALTDSITVRQISVGSGSISPAQLQQEIRNAIAADPTLVIRALPSFTAFTGGVDQEVFFVDNPIVPEESGVYAVSDDRGTNKISTA